MTNKDLINMSLNDIKKKKFRSFLTILSIGIGTMLVIIMFGIGNGLTQKINTQVKSMLGNSNVVTIMPYEKSKDGSTVNITMGDESTEQSKPKDKVIDDSALAKFKSIDGVKDISAIINSKITSSKVMDKEGKGADIVGFNTKYTVFSSEDKETLSKIKEKNRYNKLSKEAVLAGKEFKWNSIDEVMVGQKYLDKMGIKDYNSVIGKEITLIFTLPVMEEGIEIKPVEIKGKIVGVVNGDYPQNYGKNILVSSEMAAKMQSEILGEKDYYKTKGYSNVVVNVQNNDKVKNVTSEISKMNYQFNSAVDTIEQLKNQTKIINIIFLSGGIVVLLVASFSLINTMTMSVQEKKKSIGIMKAVGASRGNITRIFLMQSAVIGFLGGILGSTIGVAATYAVNFISRSKQIAKGIENPMKLINLPAEFIIVAILFTVIIAIIAGIVPSRKAAKLDPVELLSYE